MYGQEITDHAWVQAEGELLTSRVEARLSKLSDGNADELDEILCDAAGQNCLAELLKLISGSALRQPDCLADVAMAGKLRTLLRDWIHKQETHNITPDAVQEYSLSGHVGFKEDSRKEW